ncbi:hypothetical protein [Nitrosovibrio sp. Nv17]|uniref:hypothetical protein n=1 Tax=Nitrosovibrio sp. Nv17 TaxID=1855339 RepID=UPI00090885F4|nr:hypothetical protein [Nitrosovibrio sp. Nv17]SFW38790.1 hypothetical protein SAMN05216414_13030 [Nitrosovibrio sp. Nv17]
MDFKEWTDEEVDSLREKLREWRLQRDAPTWGNRFLNWTGFMGVFALLTGLTDGFFGGLSMPSLLLVVLGALACFSWYRGDKQYKKNVGFLDELDQEYARRDRKSRKRIPK